MTDQIATSPRKAPSEDRSRQAPGTESAFSEAMTVLREDHDATATHILQDQFSRDGIGSLGIAFRSMATHEGQKGVEQYWSHLLDLAVTLWNKGHYSASVKLLKDARLRLAPPDLFLEHLQESISYGDDFIIFQRVQKRFLDGDEDGARSILRNMSLERRGEIEAELIEKSKDRKKSRKAAFVISSALGLVLVAASIAGILSFRDFIRNPPTFRLPDFDLQKSVPEFPEAVSFVPDIPALPAPPPGDPGGIASDDPGQIFAATPPGASQPHLEEDAGAAITPGAEAAAEDIEAKAEHPSQASEKAPLPTEETREAGAAEKLYNCALGFRVAALATRLAEDSGENRQISRVSEFNEKFVAACSDLPISIPELQSLAKNIADDYVQQIAESILK